MNVLTHSHANANVSVNHLPVLEYGYSTTLPIRVSVLMCPSVLEAKFTIQKHACVSALRTGCPCAQDISSLMTLRAVASVLACPSVPTSRTSLRIRASACVRTVQPAVTIASSDTMRKLVAVSALKSYLLFFAPGAGIALIMMMMILHLTAEAATAAPSAQEIFQTQVTIAEKAIQAVALSSPNHLMPLPAVNLKVLDHLMPLQAIALGVLNRTMPPQARTVALNVPDHPVTLHPPGEGTLQDSLGNAHVDNG